MARPRGSKNKTTPIKSKDPLNQGLKFGAKAVGVNEHLKQTVGIDLPDSPETASDKPVDVLQEGGATTPQGTEEKGSETILEPVKDKEVLVHGIDFTQVVKEIVYLGYLDAVMKPKVLPQLKGVPFSAKFLVSQESLDKFNENGSRPEWQEGVEYKKVVISNTNPMVYVKCLLDAGKAGAVFAPKAVVRPTQPYQAVLYTRVAVSNPPSLKTLPSKKLKYSKDELDEMKMSQLQSIGKEFGVSGRSKEKLIEDILGKQE